MFKALLKKQIKEIMSTYVASGKREKKGQSIGVGGIIGFAVLYMFVLASLAMAFVGVSISLSGVLFNDNVVSENLDWLYFSMIGSLSIIVGIAGSVFGVYASIYKSKDNEFLLSLPVPSGKIVMSRLLSTGIVSFCLEAACFIPAVIIYGIERSVGALRIIAALIVGIISLTVIVLALTCLLAWLVALVTRSVKNKTFITVLAMIAFLAVYFLFYFNLNDLLNKLLAEALTIGVTIRKAVWPLYLFGRACTGDILSIVLLLLITAAALFIVYFAISKNFVKMVSFSGRSKSSKRVISAARSDISKTLLAKEFKHFGSCASYIVNCSLGTLIMTVGAAALIIKKNTVQSFVYTIRSELGYASSVMTVVLILFLEIITSMNNLTAPSVSFEGNTFWILKSLPLDMRRVIQAKVKMHLILTLIPLALLLASLEYVVCPGIADFLLVAACSISFVVFQALFGIAVNIKFPKFDWTNETVAVKQGLSVGLGLFIGWIVCFIEGLVYFLIVKGSMQPLVFGLIILAINIALVLFLSGWLKGKGAEEMAALNS